MKVRIRIKRFERGKDREPYWSEHEIEGEPTDRLLDALHTVKWYQDNTLAFRRSCAHGICGSDAMVVNGRNRLACRELLRDLGDRITVEPLRGFPVIKDLVVDMDAFFEKYRSIRPYLITGGEHPTEERRQTPQQRERFDDTTKCILCAACTTSCPSFWSNGKFLGPATLVNAHRFLFDTRDEASTQRLELLGDREAAWRCRTIFNCTEACPRGIQVTKAIGEVKKALLTKGV